MVCVRFARVLFLLIAADYVEQERGFRAHESDSFPPVGSLADSAACCATLTHTIASMLAAQMMLG